MNVRLFLAGVLTFLAGLHATGEQSWVVWAFGVAMITASLLEWAMVSPLPRAQSAPQRPAAPPAGPTPKREVIVRERWRERRERYWPFDPSSVEPADRVDAVPDSPEQPQKARHARRDDHVA